MYVLDLPVCVGGPQAVAVAEGEDVRLTCEVDAQPEDNLHFTWYFNNTLDTVEVERHRIEVRPGHSFLDYTPRWVDLASRATRKGARLGGRPGRFK